jgi:hypothetical protein
MRSYLKTLSFSSFLMTLFKKKSSWIDLPHGIYLPVPSLISFLASSLPHKLFPHIFDYFGRLSSTSLLYLIYFKPFIPDFLRSQVSSQFCRDPFVADSSPGWHINLLRPYEDRQLRLHSIAPRVI